MNLTILQDDAIAEMEFKTYRNFVITEFLILTGILKVPVSYIQHVDTGTFIYLSYATYSLARLFIKSY